MPIVKTEVQTRTRANVAYTAALLGLSESEVYGIILDKFAGGADPSKLAAIIGNATGKGETDIDTHSQDTQ